MFAFEVTEVDRFSFDLDRGSPKFARANFADSALRGGGADSVFWEQLLAFLERANDQVVAAIIQTLIEPAWINLFSSRWLHNEFAERDLRNAVGSADRGHDARATGGSLGYAPRMLFDA